MYNNRLFSFVFVGFPVVAAEMLSSCRSGRFHMPLPAARGAGKACYNRCAMRIPGEEGAAVRRTLFFALAPFLISPLHGADRVETVAVFKGQQVTGVSVSAAGRIFVNFPRWRKNLALSVAEVFPDGSLLPYPDREQNSWRMGEAPDDRFVAVQSVLAAQGRLYVLDTGNPMFGGVLHPPKVHVYDLEENLLTDTYVFPEHVYERQSYLNDLRIDERAGRMYLTDSGVGAIVAVDLEERAFHRYHHRSEFTRADRDALVIDGKQWAFQVHSDGIALDRKNRVLYIHSLTGSLLHGFRLDELAQEKPPFFTLKTASPDGMILDDRGNLYFGDLENHAILYLEPDRETIRVLVEGDRVSWADTFSLHDGHLYYTNSRIHEAVGDISGMEFQLNRVRLPRPK